MAISKLKKVKSSLHRLQDVEGGLTMIYADFVVAMGFTFNLKALFGCEKLYAGV